MEDINYLLSDKYVEFAEHVISQYRLKKIIEKKLNDNRKEYNALVNALNDIKNNVAKAQGEFEAWKKECLANSGDG